MCTTQLKPLASLSILPLSVALTAGRDKVLRDVVFPVMV